MNKETEQAYILLDPADNTLTALVELAEGRELRIAEDDEPLVISGRIPYAHKFARRLIRRGEKVIKYGEIIGIATCDIHPGTHVHVHNVKGLRA
jgi:altronate dehydratase small subunit